MKKSDLKNGMIVELRDRTRYMCIDYKLIGMNSYEYMSAYNDDLTFRWEDIGELKDLDIVKVYDSQTYTINDVFNTNIPAHFLLWEREDEVDWTKVEFGTKVRCWDESSLDQNRYEGVFLEYVPNDEEYPFRVYIREDLEICWECCELI